MHVSILSIICMAISACISIGLPIVLFVYFRKKYSAKYLPMIIGAAAFIIFVLVLERSVHLLVFAKTALKENPVLYIVYGVLMAGVFEESARFICFNIVKKKYDGIGAALSYGVGHGGIEAILLSGVAMVTNIVFCVILNTGNAEVLTGKLQGSALDKMNEAIHTLVSSVPYLFLLSGIERILAICTQLSLSVLVFYSVYGKNRYGKNRTWLFPLAILLHAIIDIPAAAAQAGVLKSILLIEGIVGVCAIAVVLLAMSVHKKLRGALLLSYTGSNKII